MAHKYSPSEERLLALLIKQREPINTEKLCKQFYKSGFEPFNARLVINGTVRNLIRKVALNKEPFRVKKTAQRGPKPMEVWIEKTG